MLTLRNDAQSTLIAAKAVAERELDLGITPIDTSVVRGPWGSVSMNLRAARTVLSIAPSNARA
jgi:hypothetical protein